MEAGKGKEKGIRKREWERESLLPLLIRLQSYELSSHLMTSFNLNYRLKTQSPKTVTLGVRPSVYELGEKTQLSPQHLLTFPLDSKMFQEVIF